MKNIHMQPYDKAVSKYWHDQDYTKKKNFILITLMEECINIWINEKKNNFRKLSVKKTF